MNLPSCPNPKASPRHVEVRCGHCPACVQVRESIYAMFDAGLTAMAVARKCSVPPRVPAGFRTSWRASREAGQANVVDLNVERPRCACGLSIDKDHTPETCDMRVPRSTGMGQMDAFTW
jgi:hypothetical protein